MSDSFNAADIQALINAGLGFGAAVIGQPFTQYRPSSATNPLASGNIVGTGLTFYLDPDFKFSGAKPALFGKPIFGAMGDRTAMQVGDYLQDVNGGNYFVAAQQPLLPMAVVQCNRTLTFTRPAPIATGSGGYGPQPYSGQGGASRSTMVPYLTAWPASALQGTKGEANPTGLPDDVRAPWLQVILPAFSGVTINTSDQITDDLGRTFTVSSVEYSPLGARLTAMYSDA